MDLKKWWQRLSYFQKGFVILITLPYLFLFLYFSKILDRTILLWLMIPISILFLFICSNYVYGSLFKTEKFVDISLANRHRWIFESLFPPKTYKRDNYRKFVIISGWVMLVSGIGLLGSIIFYILRQFF